MEPIRDLTYVEDTVEGFLAVAKSPKAVGEVINVGNGKGIRIGELARLILDIMGKEQVEIASDEKRIRPEKSEVYELICNRQKAKEICGWTPRTSLKEGIKETVSWIEKNSEIFKSHIYNL